MKRRGGRDEERRHVDVESMDDDLGVECEAVLGGEYVTWLLAEGLPIPGWAWLNRAAHGTFEQIGHHVHELGVPEQPCCFPHAALLVEAIIVADVGPADLARVQRELLVPLELEVISQAVSPRAVLDRVARALHRT